ncbi:MAG: hypothetical protein QXK74_05205 [Candidatus Nitrosocaldaceae archaeon]
MNFYIINIMIKHIVLRIVLLSAFAKKKYIDKTYNIRLINANENEIIKSALFIAIIFGIITILLVSYIKGSNINIIVASILLSIGLGQQFIALAIDALVINLNNFISIWNSIIYTLARMRHNDEWRYIENECSKIFIYPHIIYSLPTDLGVKASLTKLVGYVIEKKNDINYPHKVDDTEQSLLSFAEYTVEYLREKLVLYDYLTNIQQRTSNVNPIIFIAIGTLIWLLS